MPGITPQLNSTKFAGIEIMMNQQHTSNQVMMRPTSSRVGNFLSSDKPASESSDNKAIAAAHYINQHHHNGLNHKQKAYLPSNLPLIEKTVGDSNGSSGVTQQQ